MNVAKQYKEKVNKLIEEFMEINDVYRMKQEVFCKIDSIDVLKRDNEDAQILYYYYSNLFELLTSLQEKRIGFVKSALLRFKEQDMPIVCEILKQVA